jgi:small neutral amino acid transporter SnatA (MarC family)
MGSIIGGLVAAVIGLIWFIAGKLWFELWVVLKGVLPAMLVGGGAIAIIAGVSSIKDKIQAKKEEAAAKVSEEKKEEEKKE